MNASRRQHLVRLRRISLVVGIAGFVLALALALTRPASTAWIAGWRTAVVVALIFISTRLGRTRVGAVTWLGPVGLIVLVFLLHLLAEDWLSALQPGWHSTAFPLVWMTGQALAGLACAVFFALMCDESDA